MAEKNITPDEIKSGSDFLRCWKNAKCKNDLLTLSGEDFDKKVYNAFSSSVPGDIKNSIPTPRELVKLILDNLDKFGTTKFSSACDPFAGTGGILLKIGKKYEGIKLYGAEKNDLVFEILETNLEKNEIKAILKNDWEELLETNKRRVYKTFDLIFTNPPSDIIDQIQKEKEGKKTKRDGKNIEYLEQFITSLKDNLSENGFLLIFLTDDLLSQLDSIKETLFEDLNLKALVKFPKGSIGNLDQNLLIFQKQPYENKTYYINLREENKNNYIGVFENIFKDFDKIKKAFSNIKDNLTYSPYEANSRVYFVNFLKTSLRFVPPTYGAVENWTKLSLNLACSICSGMKHIEASLSEQGIKLNMFSEEYKKFINFDGNDNTKPSEEIIKEYGIKRVDFFKRIGGKVVIDNKVLYEILISLQINNFLILSGPSGVGKTKFVSSLEEIINSLEGVVIKADLGKYPVKSNRFDESDTLGYWNNLLSEYNTGKFLKILAKAATYTERPFFILLDEMNLAKIENYFSAFISGIDQLKDEGKFEIILFEESFFNDERYQSKWKKLKNFIKTMFEGISSGYEKFLEIRTLENESFEEDKIKEMILFLESGLPPTDLIVKFKIPVYPNVHVIGTINEDETVAPISNRVYDRASYILMEPKFEEDKEDEVKNENYLLLNAWKYVFKEQERMKDILVSESEFIEFIKKLNNKLKQIDLNLQFGYRSIEYMVNFKKYAKKLFGLDEKVIMDMVLVQKLYPRLKNAIIDEIGQIEGIRDIVKNEVNQNAKILELIDYLIMEN